MWHLSLFVESVCYCGQIPTSSQARAWAPPLSSLSLPLLLPLLSSAHLLWLAKGAPRHLRSLICILCFTKWRCPVLLNLPVFCELTLELLIPICWLHDVILCWGIPPGFSSLDACFFLAVKELSKQGSGSHPRQLPVLPVPLLSPGFSLVYTWILPHHHLLEKRTQYKIVWFSCWCGHMLTARCGELHCRPATSRPHA